MPIILKITINKAPEIGILLNAAAGIMRTMNDPPNIINKENNIPQAAPIYPNIAIIFTSSIAVSWLSDECVFDIDPPRDFFVEDLFADLVFNSFFI
jgi:hypothetical protein